MMVDEKKAQHISEVQKVYLCSAHCKVSLIRIQANMDIDNKPS
jgi:hypothetical protein